MTESLRAYSAKKIFLFSLIFIIFTDLAIFLDIPFLRQILGFLFLTFLPGLVILHILRLNKLSRVETILYSVGLSIAFSMSTGFFINLLYPFFGIPNPLSTVPLIITISILVILLSVISYLRNKGLSGFVSIDIKELYSPSVLFLVLLPFLIVLVACLFYFYGNNVILLLLLGLISLAVILAVFGVIQTKLFPLVIVTTALGLLLYQVLTPFYFLAPGDLQWEYYTYKIVEMNSYWDPATSGNLNAMLSVVMYPTIFSKLLNIDGAWILKIVYPLIFALVPLALYRVYQKQTTERVAFLSSFFFMSVFAFFITLPFIPRQEIAGLFYALLILLLVSKEMNGLARAALVIIFGGSIIVSHYGLSYIFLLQIFIALLILHTMLRRPTINDLIREN